MLIYSRLLKGNNSVSYETWAVICALEKALKNISSVYSKVVFQAPFLYCAFAENQWMILFYSASS